MQNLILISSVVVDGTDYFRTEIFGCDSTIHTHDFDKATHKLDFTPTVNAVAAIIKKKVEPGPILFRSPLENTIISI